jgi:hypothetical protein
MEGEESYELRPIRPTEDDIRINPPEDEDLLPTPRRYSMSSTQSYELYTPDEDKAVLQKLDRRLVPFMALLYCLSFLDRSSESHLWIGRDGTCEHVWG